MSRSTPGLWQWRVVDGSRVMLGTEGRGFIFVMGFKRLGMQSAQPIFQVDGDDCDQACHGCGRMTPAMELAAPFDHNGVGFLDLPDARLIAVAPDLLEALEAIAGGMIDGKPDAPDIAKAESPLKFASDIWGWSQDVARAAIQKATGELA